MAERSELVEKMFDETYELGYRAGHVRGFMNALLFVIAAFVVACFVWWIA